MIGIIARAIAIAACTTLTAAHLAQAQELVVNGGFDGSVEGWEALNDPTASGYSDLDADNRPDSGSIWLSSSEALPGLPPPLRRQCMPLSERSHHYVFGIDLYLTPDSQPGRGSVVYWLWSNVDCSGDPYGGLGFVGLNQGVWEHRAWDMPLPADVEAGSLEVQLAVRKESETPGMTTAHFDNITFIADGLLLSGFE